jgi:hypothetical protein
MIAMARPLLAGLILTATTAVVSAEQGPRDRECMVGEQRIEGECQPITRGPKNKGSGGN